MNTRKLIYMLEFAGLKIMYYLFKTMKPERASNFGGWLGRRAGQWLPHKRVAHRNLKTIWPDLSPAEREAIVGGVWENFGRLAAEYCHLKDFPLDTHVELCGKEVLEKLRDDGQPAILFTGHIANFQLIALICAHHGLPLVQFYKRAHNPYVDALMERLQCHAAEQTITKGREGSRALIRALRENKHLLIFIDQKSDGPMIPFLGHEAKTGPAVARLSKNFSCPLVPARVERLSGMRFRVTLYPPIAQADTEEETLTSVNRIVGDWVHKQPEQWLWIHRRWPFSSRRR